MYYFKLKGEEVLLMTYDYNHPDLNRFIYAELLLGARNEGFIEHMGSYITNLWWGGDPDIPDPFSGMSRRDIYTVQKNWATVYAKSPEYGMELFLRLFRKDPNMQSFFKNIVGMSEDQIKETVVFKAHVQNLMSSLNSAVGNLEHPEVVAALMNKLGTSHHSRHIKIRHFEVLRQVLVDFLENDLKVGEAALGSWSKFVEYIFRHIFEKLND